MIILLQVDRDCVREISAETLPSKIISTKDAYSIPGGVIRLVKTYSGPYVWHTVDFAAVQAAISYGIRGWEVKRL